MTAPSVREALKACREFIRGEQIENAVVCIGSMQSLGEMIDDALATPPAPTPSAVRERIARIIDPDAYDEAVAHKPWMKKYQEKAQNKADAILALLPDAAAIRADASYLDFFEENTDMELSCSWEDDDGPWEVHSVTGGCNDREWRKVGQGRTPREAIAAAIRAGGDA